MSLVIALKSVSGDVVLASDQLGTIGDPSGLVCTDEAQEKLLIFKTGAVAMVGDIGHLAIPVHEALAKIDRDGSEPLTTIIDTVRTHFNAHWSNKKVKEECINRPEASLVFADVRNGLTRICSLTSERDFGPSVHSLSLAVQGVYNYAFYLRKRLFRNDMTIDEITRLAIFSIYETGLVEPKVGKEPVVVKIMCSGSIVRMSKAEIDHIIKENNQRYANFATELFR